MKCVIIAAGQGTRLRSIAESKPLADFMGTPLIEHVARSAVAAGVTEIVVVTGYQAAGLDAFLPGLAHRLTTPIEIVHNPDWANPNGLSLVAAKDQLGTHFILLMSDHLFDPAIIGLLVEQHSLSAGASLAVDYDIGNPLIDPDDATKVAIGEGGRIKRIGKQLTNFDAFDTGVFLATPALISAIEQDVGQGGSGSLSAGMQILADGNRAYSVDIGKLWWADVDDPPAMVRAEASIPQHLQA